MELQEAFADYRYYLQMNAHKSPRTIVSYSHDLNDYLTYLQELGIHTVEEVRECDVQDYLIEKGDVFYSCGGITVEDPKLQQCITHIDEMDRVLLNCILFLFFVGDGSSSAMYPAWYRSDQFCCFLQKTIKQQTNKQRKQHKKTTIIRMMNPSSRKILIRNLTLSIVYTTLNTRPSPSLLSNPSAV